MWVHYGIFYVYCHLANFIPRLATDYIVNLTSPSIIIFTTYYKKKYLFLSLYNNLKQI